MRRGRLLGLLLLTTACLAQPTPERLTAAAARLRAAIIRYETLLKDLDLDRLPGNLPEYPAVTEQLDRTGEQLEPLSRALLQAEHTDAATWTATLADLEKLELDLADLHRQSFTLRLWSYCRAHGQKRPEWGLAVATSLDKLPRERTAAVAEVTGTMELAAARGEAEAGQVLVVPLGKDLTHVQAGCKGLAGPGGIIPGTAVSCQPVEYLRYERLSYEGLESAWWPEVLLPPGPVDVVRDQVQPLWITVRVPVTQKPGLYRGELVVRPANSGAWRLRLEMTVWDFTLPEKPSLPVLAGLDTRALSRWYHGAAPPGAPALAALRQRYADLLAACRIGVYEVGDLPAAEVAVTAADWWQALTGGLEALLKTSSWREDLNPLLSYTYWLALSPLGPAGDFRLATDRPALEHRLLPWALWSQGAQGLLYGPVNRWEGNYPSTGTTAGLTPATWLTTQPGPWSVPGYGQLVYPGPQGEPLASMRLALLRDGLEDCEYLALAAEKAHQAGTEFTPPRTVVEPPARFTTDPVTLLQARRDLGEMLGKKPE